MSGIQGVAANWTGLALFFGANDWAGIKSAPFCLILSKFRVWFKGFAWFFRMFRACMLFLLSQSGPKSAHFCLFFAFALVEWGLETTPGVLDKRAIQRDFEDFSG